MFLVKPIAVLEVETLRRNLEKEEIVAIPEKFTRCMRCREPAEFITVGLTDMQVPAFGDIPTQDFVAALRERYGSNVEFPLCGEHYRQSIELGNAEAEKQGL